MNNLVNKFKNLEVKDVSIIPEHILSKIKEQDSKYKKARTFMLLALDEYKGVNKKLMNNPVRKEVFEDYQYLSYNDLFKASDLVDKANSELESINDRYADFIENLYNEEYNVKVSYRDLVMKKALTDIENDSEEYQNKKLAFNTRELSYIEIVKDLLDQCDGSPETQGIKLLLENFKESVNRWDKLKATLKSKVVVLEKYFYYSEKWDHTYELNDRSDSSGQNLLIRALNYFFYGKPENYDRYLHIRGYDRVSFDSDYGNERIRINLFKNGNVKLTFSSSDEAGSFYEKLCIDPSVKAA